MLLNDIPNRCLDWTLSIVSHGHGASVNRLLADLKANLDPARFEVIVTINHPDEVSIREDVWDGELVLYHNRRRCGFARNHNLALSRARGRFVAMLDPDLRLEQNPFPALEAFLHERPQALVAPSVVDSAGRIQDNARRLLTPAQLWKRYGLRRRGPDYGDNLGPVPVDWIAGLFMSGSREAFAGHGGFDERFHLYCEDAELSLRYWNNGGEVWVCPVPGVVHDARRRSLRQMRHFLWHCESLLRLWSSKTFWRFRSRLSRDGES